MQNQAATIQCSNSQCQAANPLSHKFCQECNTPLVRRYLWVVGGVDQFSVGELISDRYLLKQSQIVLDTRPGLIPNIPSEANLPYLRLFPYRLHVPTVYGALGAKPDSGILLEYRSALTDLNELLLPALEQTWQGAAALRQLNWLWQIATLWQPLQSVGAASSLIAPALVRANGSVVRLLQLRQDEQPPTLKQLGQLWLPWSDEASPELQPFLHKLCQHLIDGTIGQPEQLLAALEQGIEQSDRAQRTYQLFTITDTGPSRDHNEDHCYPPPGKDIQAASEDETLTIVCDGLGGQEGGEVASQLAVEHLVNDFASRSDHVNAAVLERAIFGANQVIAERNDREKRHESQRMGTTLAMAIARSPYLYFAHVGDSRIYLIHRGGCHQVMVDDDVASREVRRGYAIYQDAVQSFNAGSLYQALGIYSSDFLEPTIQRLVLDEDCVFLICSDGLSDNDLVEQHWDEILPILQQQETVEQVGKRLLELANQLNGHDNVTVALIHCQVEPGDGQGTPLQFFSPSEHSTVESPPLPRPDTEVDSTVAASPPRKKAHRYWLLLIVLVLGLGAGGYLLFAELIEERLQRNDSPTTRLMSKPNALSHLTQFIRS